MIFLSIKFVISSEIRTSIVIAALYGPPLMLYSFHRLALTMLLNNDFKYALFLRS